MNALLELAERCEQATGPDRELDCLMHCALKGWQLAEFDGDKFAVLPDGSRVVMLIKQRPPDDVTPRSYTMTTDSAAPLYTASLDAAMTLVPPAERWPWNVTMATFYCSASVIPNHGDSCGVSDPYAGHSQGKAATPILALCAAAIRARASA